MSQNNTERTRAKRFSVDIDPDIEPQLRGVAGFRLLSVPDLVNSILRQQLPGMAKEVIEEESRRMGLDAIPKPKK